MEPISITAVATAITTIFFSKAIEKTGENFGEFLSDKTKILIGRLSGESSKVKGLLEAEEQQPLQIGEAILEVKQIADQDSEIAEAILDVETAAKDEANPQFQKQINQVQQEAAQLVGQQPTIQNMTKLAEKIGVVNQGFIGTQNINQTII
ncbi:MAG: hypothetical protein QNJ55_20880 [Xenococcus sp. MO_188.B8]|nr:hypothetical protein [Xenococcus sp. MO_188.B8]